VVELREAEVPGGDTSVGRGGICRCEAHDMGIRELEGVTVILIGDCHGDELVLLDLDVEDLLAGHTARELRLPVRLAALGAGDRRRRGCGRGARHVDRQIVVRHLRPCLLPRVLRERPHRPVVAPRTRYLLLARRCLSSVERAGECDLAPAALELLGGGLELLLIDE